MSGFQPYFSRISADFSRISAGFQLFSMILRVILGPEVQGPCSWRPLFSDPLVGLLLGYQCDSFSRAREIPGKTSRAPKMFLKSVHPSVRHPFYVCKKLMLAWYVFFTFFCCSMTRYTRKDTFRSF